MSMLRSERKWAAFAAICLLASAAPVSAQIAIIAELQHGTPYQGILVDPATSADNPGTWNYFTHNAIAGSVVRVEVSRLTSLMDPAATTYAGSAAGLSYSNLFDGVLEPVGSGDDERPSATGEGPAGDPFYQFLAPTSGIYTTAVYSFFNDEMPLSGYEYSVTITGGGATVIVESREGGQNSSSYSEIGEFANTAGKSIALGTTADIGSRFASTFTSVVGAKQAVFAPELPVTGFYEVFTTWGLVGNRRDGVQHRIIHMDGITDVLVDQTAPIGEWVSLGEYRFTEGVGGSVEISNTGLNLSGNFIADAVMWSLVRAIPEPHSLTLVASSVAGILLRRRHEFR